MTFNIFSVDGPG